MGSSKAYKTPRGFKHPWCFCLVPTANQPLDPEKLPGSEPDVFWDFQGPPRTWDPLMVSGTHTIP